MAYDATKMADWQISEAAEENMPTMEEWVEKLGLEKQEMLQMGRLGKLDFLKIIDRLKDKYNIAVIEGDLETENDAERIRAKEIPAIQIATGTACHLDAHMLHNALHNLDLNNIDIVFIENVGNLVCPASFDLGHHLNVTLLSSTEGDDKPAKYPVMFRSSNLLLITKSDLLSVLDDFDTDRAEKYFRNLANDSPVFTISARKDTNMESWFNWLDTQLSQHRKKYKKQQIAHNHKHEHAS